ncbi:MAG: DnaB-like helicase N-terminal domain-containing protein, partial [Oscillospiraceae bacterium]|nr:DnaB-like helicase N-terminal domain-containing protein [Oscillospiraceae bacterium]
MAINRDTLEIEGAGLPFSSEAEQSVLGAILIDPLSINMVMDKLRPDHFYIPQNKKIFEVLTSMSTQSQVIDFVTVLEKLKSDGIYDDAGGKSYLTT